MTALTIIAAGVICLAFFAVRSRAYRRFRVQMRDLRVRHARERAALTAWSIAAGIGPEELEKP